MEPVIDIHAHLGDILYPGGGDLIGKSGIKKRHWFDLVSISEWFLHRLADGVDESYFGTRLHRQELKHSLKRNLTASLENFLDSMRQSGISHSVALPIAPNVSFSDLQPIAEKHSGIIPFTSIDFTRDYNVEAVLRSDVEAGAKGMKLHPILQREQLTSRRTHEVVEAFTPHGLPILIHTGVCYYYTDETDKRQREKPEYGDVQDAIKLAQAFPNVSFIFGYFECHLICSFILITFRRFFDNDLEKIYCLTDIRIVAECSLISKTVFSCRFLAEHIDLKLT